MRYSVILGVKTCILFDMEYPRSNIQGKIYLKPLVEDDTIFQEYIPFPFPLLNKFLFKKGRKFKFKSRTGETLDKSRLNWQITGLENYYLVPTKESLFDTIQRYDVEDAVEIRLQV